MTQSVAIAGRTIGHGSPCFVIAEAGSNHNGSLERARELIDVAADAGADAVKFQLFRADRMYPRSAGASAYLKSDVPIYEIIEAMEMPYEWLPELAGHARARGIAFIASGFDEEAVARLEPYVDAFKVASYEMTHLPLVRRIAEYGKPTIISTGTATLDEVRESVDAFRATGNDQLVVLQCTAAYPAPLESLNVAAMRTMREALDVPVGLSDHSRDPVIGPVVAVGAGAAALEKHFTMSNDLPGPDHRFAVEPDELRALVRAVREAEAALGSGEKTVLDVEDELRSFARRALFAVKPIEPGQEVSAENAAWLRTGVVEAEIEPRDAERALGRRARVAIDVDAAIRWSDLE